MEIDTGLVALILGLVGVILLCALITVIVWMRRNARTKVSADTLTRLIITIDPQTREAAASSVGEASTARRQRRAAVPLPAAIRFARVLWVDNDPDFSMPETIALESLGISVTKTMHADIALAYLSGMEFHAVVAGIVEDSNPEAVDAFFDRVRQSRPGIITLGYTAPNLERPPQIANLTLVRDPADLIGALVTPLGIDR